MLSPQKSTINKDALRPFAAAYAQAQQQQYAPQGFFGNLLGQVGQPLGGAIGGMFGNAGLGNTIGGIAGQLGRYLPFNVDPIAAAYAQQQAMQQAQQGGGYQGYQPGQGMGIPGGYAGQPTIH